MHSSSRSERNEKVVEGENRQPTGVLIKATTLVADFAETIVKGQLNRALIDQLDDGLSKRIRLPVCPSETDEQWQL